MEDKTRRVRKRVKLKKRNFFIKEIANFKDELRRLRSREIIVFAVIIIIFIAAIFHRVIYEYFAK